MLSKVFVVLVLGIVVGVKANCTPCLEAPKHYEELNCTGMKLRGDCCDTRYNCPESVYEKPLEKCQYRGRLYDYAELVDNSLLPSCIQEAKCVASSNGPKFEVVQEEPVPVADGCLPQYTLDKTCNPSKTVCDPVQKEKLIKCYLRDKEYYEGQLFTPTEAFGPYFSSSCYQCICDANFNNNTVPRSNGNCRKFQCAIEILNAEKLRNGCVPVYESKSPYDPEPTCCCPIDFICPETNQRETYLPKSDTPPRSCVFGDKVIGGGQTLETGHKCRTCKCNTPPALTCIQTEEC